MRLRSFHHSTTVEFSQYDQIITAMREDDNDELADKLKFKKALVSY